MLPLWRIWVLSLVRELGSHMPGRTAKKQIINKQKLKIKTNRTFLVAEVGGGAVTAVDTGSIPGLGRSHMPQRN